MRFAIAKGDLDVIRAYLPSNYKANSLNIDDSVLIMGEDNAGWTLDGYVIPRLASGWIFAEEVAGND